MIQVKEGGTEQHESDKQGKAEVPHSASRAEGTRHQKTAATARLLDSDATGQRIPRRPTEPTRTDGKPDGRVRHRASGRACENREPRQRPRGEKLIRRTSIGPVSCLRSAGNGTGRDGSGWAGSGRNRFGSGRHRRRPGKPAGLGDTLREGGAERLRHRRAVGETGHSVHSRANREQQR